MRTQGDATVDPKQLGLRLQHARKSRGLTQQQAADSLGVARTTITAIEKGERRIQASELIRLAAAYGRSVGELLRPGAPAEPFTVQLRAVLAPGMQVETELATGLEEFERLCEYYVDLERIRNAPLPRRYPQPYIIKGLSPDQAGEDVASSERDRLALGDGPLLNLREVLENDVGLRVFYIDLPSRVAEMFAYNETYGGCLAINHKHPAERRRMSIAHGYAHFLTTRYRPEVGIFGRYQRVPEHERFADAFARAFLMPGSALRRRFNDVKRARGTFTPSDLCTLANLYFVSVEAMTLRLEDLRLLPQGTWERLRTAGFKIQEAQATLNLPPRVAFDQMLPLRYQYLAVEAYGRGDLTEGELARYLRVDRLEARRVAAELANRPMLDEDGAQEVLSLDLGESLSA